MVQSEILKTPKCSGTHNVDYQKWETKFQKKGPNETISSNRSRGK